MEKPAELGEILELSKKLAKDIPFVRVDFYIINHKVYFSEMTFFPASGFAPFEPDEWDATFGSWLKLPEKIRFLYARRVFYPTGRSRII